MAGYFTRNPLVFHEGKRTTAMPSRRTVAVEMEVSGVYGREAYVENAFRDAIDRWSASVVEDSSIEDDGFELRTAPATGDKFVAQIEDLTSHLSELDAWVTQKAGLHVHVGTYDYRWADHLNLAWLWAHVESAAFTIMPPSRRSNSYCQRNRDLIRDRAGEPRDLTSAERKAVFVALVANADHTAGCSWEYDSTKEYEKAKASADRAHAKGMPYIRPAYVKSTRVKRKPEEFGYSPGGSRYYALNYQSVFAHGTIEFRLHSGTTAAHKIIPWAAWCAALVDLARKLDAKGVAEFIASHPNPWDAFLAVAPEVHRAYFTSRRDWFAGGR